MRNNVVRPSDVPVDSHCSRDTKERAPLAARGAPSWGALHYADLFLAGAGLKTNKQTNKQKEQTNGHLQKKKKEDNIKVLHSPTPIKTLNGRALRSRGDARRFP